MEIFKVLCIAIFLNFDVNLSDMSADFETPQTNDDIKSDITSISEDMLNVNMKASPTTEVSNTIWNMNRAVRDVAYYLRAHKFLDYDHRYYKTSEESLVKLYHEFPKPPLRSLHWEVHRHCISSFTECLKYLDTTVQLTSLKRSDDITTIINQKNLHVAKDNEKILSLQKNCQMAQHRDNLTFVPFQGPIERFQWRTSAAYYMCWYTMLETPQLGLFGESCDNHANCLDVYGANNKDPRADDSQPFACAMYSFCPDHCCPMKHIWYMKDCFQNPENPCYRSNNPGARKCSLSRESNQDLNALMSNQMNISCKCETKGYEWSSRFGLCVDVNECVRGLHNCSLKDGQICINLPSSFDCLCQYGMVWNIHEGKCDIVNVIKYILQNSSSHENSIDETAMQTLIKTLTRSSGSLEYSRHSLHFCFYVVCILMIY